MVLGFLLHRLSLRQPRSMNLWPSGCCKTEAWFFFEVGHWVGKTEKMFVHIEKSHDFPVKRACSMCVFVDVKPSAFGFWRQFQKDYVEEKEALAPSKCRYVSCTFLFCRLLKFHTVLGADSRVHCCYIGKHHSPSQSDQQDGYILINGIPS